MDVGIAADAESGGVSLAGDGGRGLLADPTHPDSLVACGELVGGVDPRVAGQAEKGQVRSLSAKSATLQSGLQQSSEPEGLGGHGRIWVCDRQVMMMKN